MPILSLSHWLNSCLKQTTELQTASICYAKEKNIGSLWERKDSPATWLISGQALKWWTHWVPSTGNTWQWGRVGEMLEDAWRGDPSMCWKLNGERRLYFSLDCAGTLPPIGPLANRPAPPAGDGWCSHPLTTWIQPGKPQVLLHPYARTQQALSSMVLFCKFS